jgi:hypothetical protein
MKIVDKIDRFVEDHKTTIVTSLAVSVVTAAVAIATTRSANTVNGARAVLNEDTGALRVWIFQKNGRDCGFDWPDANLSKKA